MCASANSGPHRLSEPANLPFGRRTRPASAYRRSYAAAVGR
jgi:hypothetical protein